MRIHSSRSTLTNFEFVFLGLDRGSFRVNFLQIYIYIQLTISGEAIASVLVYQEAQLYIKPTIKSGEAIAPVLVCQEAQLYI